MKRRSGCAFKNLVESDARFLAVAPLPAPHISMDMINQEVKNSLAEPAA
jgi:hypothetical protein